jgi:pilus assembly protein FimV
MVFDASSTQVIDTSQADEQDLRETQVFKMPEEELSSGAEASAPDQDASLAFETTDATPDQEKESDSTSVVGSTSGKDNLIDFDLGDFDEATTASTQAEEDDESVTEIQEMALDFDLGDERPGESSEINDIGSESIEAMEEVAQGLDDETDQVAEQLASELEELAGSLDAGVGEPEAGTAEQAEDMLDFSFDTVEPVAGELGDLSDFEQEASDLGDEFELDMEKDEDDTSVTGNLPDSEDEVDTKLDLARAYIDMGDPDGARSILDEVLEEGNDQQKSEAKELGSQLS